MQGGIGYGIWMKEVLELIQPLLVLTFGISFKIKISKKISKIIVGDHDPCNVTSGFLNHI